MRSDVAVVILAGGEGSRIGGGKPLRMLAGQRLIDRAIALSRSYSDCIAVAVRDAGQVAGTSLRALQDDAAEGPVGGLIAGVRFAKETGTPLLLTIPADMPFLPPDLLDRLANAMGDRTCALAASDGQLHPVCGLWRAHVLASVPAYLATGRRSLRGLAELVGHSTADWEAGSDDPFFNINSEEDLAEAEQRFV